MSCCPTIWWCTPEGPVEVSPDADGLYTRPATASGHPFKSLEEAADECPSRLSLTCPSCGTDYNLPRELIVSFADTTGDVNFPNSYVIPIITESSSCSGGVGACYMTGNPASDVDYGVMNAKCQSGGGMVITLVIMPDNEPGISNTGKQMQSFTPEPGVGWAFSSGGGVGGLNAISVILTCGQQPTMSGLIGRGEFSGLATSPPSPRSGYADIYLG